MEEVIKLKNLSFSYAKCDQEILDDIQISISPGQIFGLLGPSGAGKTTMIRLMTGQLQCKKGTIYLLGEDMSEFKKEVYQRIGIMLDSEAFYDRLTCYSNLKLFADIHGIPNNKVMETLKAVGLEDSITKPVKRLSTGMKQRLSLARAMIHSPDILFLDEPTNGLDPLTAELIHKLILQLKERGATIFITTHNMQEATLLCDTIGLLYQGKLVEHDKPEVIQRKYWQDDNIEITLKDGSKRILSLKKDYEELILLLKEHIVSIHSMEPSLEDVFKKVVRR